VATPAWVARLTQIENRFLDWARSPAAGRVAEEAPSGGMEEFRGRKYCVLVTYRKNGEPVPSPLWFGIGNGKLYAHTAGVKVKRVERNARVRIAPSTFRGRPVGAPIEGTARVLSSGAEGEAERWIQANYGWTRRLYYRLFAQTEAGVYLEVTPAEGG
jgi:PPOX class probable F420-dependent enzyme